MPNFEKFKKDELSHEAHQLYTAHKKEKNAENEREGHIFWYAEKTQKALWWLLNQGVISDEMKINDVLGILEETLKKINEKWQKEKN